MTLKWHEYQLSVHKIFQTMIKNASSARINTVDFLISFKENFCNIPPFCKHVEKTVSKKENDDNDSMEKK